MERCSPRLVLGFLIFALAASAAAFAEEPAKKTRTWDNDPKGVQVFILAGQSNMVGHGKADEGHDDVKGAIGSLRYQVEHDPQKLRSPGQQGRHLENPRRRQGLVARQRYHGPRAVIKGNLKIGYAQNRNPAGSARNSASAGPSAIASNSRS